MPDLDPADIERLLHDGAQRRGVTVDAHRNLIQTTAGRARVGFARALQVVADFEKMPSRERKVLVEHLAISRKRQRDRACQSAGSSPPCSTTPTRKRPPDTDERALPGFRGRCWPRAILPR